MHLLEGRLEAALASRARVRLGAPGRRLVKVPLTPDACRTGWEMEDAGGGVYSVGANLAWVAWQGESDTLDEILDDKSEPACPRGAAQSPRLG